MKARAMHLFRRAKGKKFVRDTAVMQLASLMTVMAYAGTSVMISRHLGDEQVGRWGAARDMFSMVFMTLTSGLLQVSVARYAKAVGAQRRDEATATLAALLKLFLICSLLVLLVGVAWAPAFAQAQYGDRQVGVIAAILCATGFGEALKSPMVVALRGARAMGDYARFEIVINTVRLALIAVVVGLGFGLLGVMWAFVTHSVVVAVWSLVIFNRLQHSKEAHKPPPLKEILLAVPRASVRSLIGTAYFLSIFKVMHTMIPRLGNVIIPMAGITLAGSFGEGGHFYVAGVAALALRMLCSAVTQTLMPALGLRLGGTDTPFEAMGHLIFKVTLVSGLCVSVVAAISIPVMNVAFDLVWGPEFAEAAGYYPWLALGAVLTAFSVAIEPFYIYSGKMSLALRQNIVLFLVSVTMIVTAAVTYGPKGVAVATGLAPGLAVFHLVYIWWYFHRAAAQRADS